MDQNLEQNQSPFPAQPAPRSGNIGPLAAAVVIVLLFAAGGFYFFYDQQQRQAAADAAQAQGAVPGNETATVPDNSTESIESDLNATQTSGADASVSDLEGAL